MATLSCHRFCAAGACGFVKAFIHWYCGGYCHFGLDAEMAACPPEKAIGALMQIRAFFLRFSPDFIGLKRV